MASTVSSISTLVLLPHSDVNSITRICFLAKNPSNYTKHSFSSNIPTFSSHLLCTNGIVGRRHINLSPKAASSSSSVVSSDFIEEPTTKVKFQTSLSLPGCSSTLSLLGTGYREKVFAIIGVKVYAAGLYANQSLFSNLDAWRGRSNADLQRDSLLFDTIFRAPMEKSLNIVLIRDIDGKTFWDALDEAISPRIKSPTQLDESALSTFRSVFQGRPLKKGTSIFLTWLDTTNVLVCVSPDGVPPAVDATIESSNVAFALFDVFLGGNPVSPSLKASVSNGLAAALK